MHSKCACSKQSSIGPKATGINSGPAEESSQEVIPFMHVESCSHQGAKVELERDTW